MARKEQAEFGRVLQVNRAKEEELATLVGGASLPFSCPACVGGRACRGF